jgi:hypothetical protein
MRFVSSEIDDLRSGNSNASKAYHGNTLVWFRPLYPDTIPLVTADVNDFGTVSASGGGSSFQYPHRAWGDPLRQTVIGEYYYRMGGTSSITGTFTYTTSLRPATYRIKSYSTGQGTAWFRHYVDLLYSDGTEERIVERYISSASQGASDVNMVKQVSKRISGMRIRAETQTTSWVYLSKNQIILESI